MVKINDILALRSSFDSKTNQFFSCYKVIDVNLYDAKIFNCKRLGNFNPISKQLQIISEKDQGLYRDNFYDESWLIITDLINPKPRRKLPGWF